jgi:hypothetical protein
MTRWLILTLVFYVLVRIIYRLSTQRKPIRSREPEVDDMVLDPQCKSYFPRKEAVVCRGVPFCSTKCADTYFAPNEVQPAS